MDIEERDAKEMYDLYVNQGVPVDTLSDEYAYPRSAIYRMLKESGAIVSKGRPSLLDSLSDSAVEEITKDYLNWMPLHEIMVKYNIHSLAVLYNLLTTLEIGRRRHAKDYIETKMEMFEQAVDMYQKGYPIWTIEEATGIDAPRLYRKLREKGGKPNRHHPRGVNVTPD